MLLNDNLGSNYYGVIVIVSLVIVFKFIFNHNELFIAKKTFSSIFIIAGLIGFHLFIAVNLFELEKEENIFKILLSLLSLVAIFIACIFSINSLLKIDDNAFLNIVNNIFNILLLVGIYSSVMMVLGGKTDKRMLFFTEPSHYALIVTIFYAYKIAIKKTNIIYCLPLFIIALCIQNLSLIIGVTFAISINFLRLRTLLLIPLILVPLYTIAINVISQDRLDYYFQRLNISENSTNTSTLTLMSGYEQAYLALKDSYGFGFGLQRMGYPNNRGSFVDIIGSLRDGNTDSNLHDGGLFISKLTVEFGVLGVGFFLYVTMLGVKNINTRCLKSKFFSMVLVMSLMYFLLRGSGYFTPSAILIFMSIVFIKAHRIKNMESE